MSMSAHIVGIMPPTEAYTNKVKAWHACKVAGVEIPIELRCFFNHTEPDPAGMMVDIKMATLDYKGQDAEGYDVDITKLPKGVQIIRFYNSW